MLKVMIFVQNAKLRTYLLIRFPCNLEEYLGQLTLMDQF